MINESLPKQVMQQLPSFFFKFRGSFNNSEPVGCERDIFIYWKGEGEGSRGQKNGIGRHIHTLYALKKITGKFTWNEKTRIFIQGMCTPMRYSHDVEKQTLEEN